MMKKAWAFGYHRRGGSALSLLLLAFAAGGCSDRHASRSGRGDASAPDDAGVRDLGAGDLGTGDFAVADLGGEIPLPGEGTFLVIPMTTPHSKDPGESPQLFRMKSDGTGLVQLTRPTGTGLPTDANDAPVLTRDRKTLYFASGRDFPPATQESDVINRTVWVMASSGGGAHRLTSNDHADCNEYPDDVSPDGQWVIFTMTCGRTGNSTPGHEKLYRIHSDGTGQEKLVAANDSPLNDSTSDVNKGRFTSDGKLLVYWSGDAATNVAELWTLDMATMKTKKLTDTAKEGDFVMERQPMIGPQDRAVYFHAASQRIEKINIDGTGAGVVFGVHKGGGGSPTDDLFALAPAGDAFVFAAATVGVSTAPESGVDIFTSRLDGMNRKPLFLSKTSIVGWGDIAWR